MAEMEWWGCFMCTHELSYSLGWSYPEGRSFAPLYVRFGGRYESQTRNENLDRCLAKYSCKKFHFPSLFLL